LNLTWETLEGIAKHNGPVVGKIPYALADYNARHDLELHTHASAEAQVAALADDIAYNNHDLMDGLRAGLFAVEDLMELPLVGACFREVDATYPGLDAPRRQHEALRRFFGLLVEDVIGVSQANLAQLAPATATDIRAAGRMMVQFSPALWRDLQEIRSFLFAHMYRAPKVVAMRAEVTEVLHALFPLFMADPSLLPEDWAVDVAQADELALARLVADYIAGMTDRFALQAHARLVSA
jgi:dGTPase